MHDVARHAGVSQSTVSLVVNQDRRVAPETTARVQRSIEELGYRANAAARALRSETTRTLGFVTQEVATSPFAGRTILGAQDAAWQRDHVLLIVDAGNSQELAESAVRVLIDQDVSGVIIAALASSAVQIPQALRTVPSIVVNGYALNEPDFPTIDPNDILGGEIAGRALIDAGHREIVLLGGGADDTTREREIGFRRAMASAPGSPAHYRIIAGEYSIRSGYLRMRAILEDAQWIPTAVFAINDRAALGAIQAITEAGYRVPEDISVIGYDDEPFLASDIHPALTTVLLPHYEMGQLGVLALLEHPGERPPAGRRDATPRLIQRDSLAPPRSLP